MLLLRFVLWVCTCLYLVTLIQDARSLNAKTVYCGHNAVVEVWSTCMYYTLRNRISKILPQFFTTSEVSSS